MSRAIHARIAAPFHSTVAMALVLACTSSGGFEGEMTRPASAQDAARGAPPVLHERVRFSWTSTDGGQSGPMRVLLPTGEAFDGEFHQITAMTSVDRIDGIYGAWRGGVWTGPAWSWGGTWPAPDDMTAFVTAYSGKVVAVLDSPSGKHMRCFFELADPEAGMSEGGTGECQISTGDRITAWFGRAGSERVSQR